MFLEGSKFVVDEKPYCAWEISLIKNNQSFIKKIEPKYFKYLSNVNFNIFKNDKDELNHQFAALSLRIAYSHALETFFALLFSALQAPDCISGWLKKYAINDLINLINKVSTRKKILSKIELESFTWRGIANTIFQNVKFEDEENTLKYKEKFGILWKLLSNDFIDTKIREEYNSLKHGFRITPGGFGIAVGLQDAPDIPAPPERMKTIGYSKFGSTFPIEEKLWDKDPNFRLKKLSRNWEVENFFHALNLISLSISNVQVFIKLINGIDPTECKFEYPQSLEYFDEPWKRSVGINDSSFDVPVSLASIPRITKEEILNVYYLKNT